MDKSLLSLSDRRVLGVALAHELAKCKPGRDHARLAILNRLFHGSSWNAQTVCKAELVRHRHRTSSAGPSEQRDISK